MQSLSIVSAGLLGLAAALAGGPPTAADPLQSGVVSTQRSPHAALREVPIRAVTMEDGFWKRRMEANRRNGIPRLLDRLEENGWVDNFRRLSGRKACPRRGPLFTDSDLYKWMEAAAISLQSTDEPELRKWLDGIIDEVLAAQQKDGYLNTWYVDERAGKRFTNLAVDHELYCAGHLFQAAAAHHRATGGRTLLDGATRFADYLCATFGPGKTVQGHCGHPEIEMSLVELYRATGDQKYLDLAKYYLDDYGFTRETGVHGHAVRMMYICCGGTDYYAESGETPLLDTADRLWSDLVAGKMYITGGVGSRAGGEAIGEAFELPNATAYAETCAAIGNAMWNWRMLGVRPDAKYADLMERCLYNGVISGVSLEGSDWFYVNPLEYASTAAGPSRGGNRRQPWFGTTCCPSNMVRTLAAIPGYVFSTSGSGVYVHLYDNCRLDWRLADGTGLRLVQKTKYPWDGLVRIEIAPEKPAEFELNLRIPGWCESAAVKVNGQDAEVKAVPGSYLRVARRWQAGDVVTLDMAMPVVAVACDERVADNRGRVALQRGPVIYCLEGIDNPGVALDRVCLKLARGSVTPPLSAAFEDSLLDGIVALKGAALELAADTAPLYRPPAALPAHGHTVQLTAIPYYAWANREPAAMSVWLRYVWE